MNNLDALKAQCKLICNTCYVDDDVANLTLMNEGLYPDDEAYPQDPCIIKSSILIVKGWIENSRSENGISVSANIEQVKKNIAYWCKVASLDASDYIDEVVIENGSNTW